MKEIDNASEYLGFFGTLEQMVMVLGFEDLLSFLLVSIFILVAIAFGAASIVFLVKKRRERLDQLQKIVNEVQKEKTDVTAVEMLPRPAAEETQVLSKPLDAAVTPEALPPKEEIEERPADDKKSLGAALRNTRGGFIEKLTKLFKKTTKIRDEDFEEIEAILFTADIGIKTAQKLLDTLRERVAKEKNADMSFLQQVLKDEMCRILESAAMPNGHDKASPEVMMFVGVNGAGKTTSIGKLGAQLKNSGKKVLFGAGDTFRAAATLQLSLWGERVGADVVVGKENSDSASVLFDAIEKGKKDNVDVVLCDTAGRLHTKHSLMDELRKVCRVVGKAQSGAPHEVFLVIDATMGQNAITQAREFALAAPLTGVVLSKLDGTAKGGVALGIVDELKIPIRYVGIGEQITDLTDFNARAFVDALFEEV